MIREDSGATRRTDWILIITLAMVVRVVFCFVVYPHVADQFGAGDGYDVIALNLAHGNGYVLDGHPAAAERLPLYPALLALSFVLFGAVSWPWQLAQCVCSAMTCAVVVRLARRYTSRRGALAAGLLCAVHPTLLLYVARPLTETLYTLLLLLFVREVMASEWRVVAAGALVGLQSLVRNTGFLQIGAFVPAILHGRFGAAARALAVAGVVVLPWGLWNQWTSGAPHVLTARGGITLYHGVYISRHVGWTTPTGDLNRDAELALWQELAVHGVHPDADIERRDRLAGQLARAWISSHPGDALRLWVRNLVLTWYLGRSRLSMLVHFVVHGLLLVAAAVGARRLWSCGARNLVIVAAVLVSAYTGFHAAVQPAVRYIIPVVPVAALLAAGIAARPELDPRQ